MTDATEQALLAKAAEAVELLKGSDPYFAEAGAKFLVRELCWLLVDKDRGDMIGEHDLAEHLEGMAESLRHSAKARSTEA